MRQSALVLLSARCSVRFAPDALPSTSLSSGRVPSGLRCTQSIHSMRRCSSCSLCRRSLRAMSALGATKDSVTIAMTIVASIHVQMAVKASMSMIDVTGSSRYQWLASHTDERPSTTV